MGNEIFEKQEQTLQQEIKKTYSQVEIPVESVTLPSNGIVYDMNNVLSGEESVEIKCMSAKEEDILSSRALIKNGTVITHLLRACITNKAVDPDDMLVGDRNAVLIAIRITGYGSDYKVKIGCPSCSEEFENVFDLSKLSVKPIGAQPLALNTNLFEYILPSSGMHVHFKLLTGKDESEISRMAEKKKKLQTQIDNTVTSRLYSCIVSINGNSDKNFISKAINNMRAGDSRAFRKYVDSIEPGVNMLQKVTCPHCNDESEVTIPLGINFFWPDLS